MIDLDRYNSLVDDDKVAFVLGSYLYNKDTNRGSVSITKDTAENYTDTELEAILFFIMFSDDIDIEFDTVAFRTAEECAGVLSKRRNRESENTARAKWEQFKRLYIKEG